MRLFGGLFRPTPNGKTRLEEVWPSGLHNKHSYLNYTNYTCYGSIRECELLIPVDVVVVTAYVNVHRCQEDDGRIQVMMVERPSSLKLENKQRIHYNGSDQYIKNILK